MNSLCKSLLAIAITVALAGDAGLALAQQTTAQTTPPADTGPNGPPSTAPPATSKSSPPEKISPTGPGTSSGVQGGASSSSQANGQGAGAGGAAAQGVITPPPTGDKAIQKPTPDPGPNSMPVITPPANSQTVPK
jgi:hypothetical protein